MSNQRIQVLSNHLVDKEDLSRSTCSADIFQVVGELADQDLISHLEGENRVWRKKVFSLLQNSSFDLRRTQNKTKEVQREITRERVRALLDSGLDIVHSHGKKYDEFKYNQQWAAMQFYDNAVLTLIGAQYVLFSQSIAKLGTKIHIDKYLVTAQTGKVFGCFGLTELGHGSNAKGIETTATYDEKTQEFVINTPNDLAQKYWIGGGAEAAQLCVCWAQLITQGKNHGIHAFLIRIRDENLKPVPNVTIKDCGFKMGINGVDNGRFWFHNLRVPRDSLLNRYADVDPSGNYSSPLADNNSRFGLHMSMLSDGRVHVSRHSTQATKMALATSIRYAFTRKQFGPPGGEEIPIMEYLTHQRRLLPLLATTYCHHFAAEDLYKRVGVFSATAPPKELQKDNHLLSSGMKALCSWHQIKTLQICREACGGQGVKGSNLIGIYKSEMDVHATYEGDNWVLLQTVARGVYNNPIDASTEVFKADPDEATLMCSKFQLAVFRKREHDLSRALKQKAQSLKSSKLSDDELWNQLSDVAGELGVADIERRNLEVFIRDGEEKAKTPRVKELLSLLRSMYALSRIDGDSTFLKRQYFSPAMNQHIHDQVEKLLLLLKPHSLYLVNSFGIPNHLLGTIAGDWISANALSSESESY